MNNQPPKKDYNFSHKNPNDILTPDELAHFDEGMRMKNESCSADEVDFKGAVESVIRDLDILLP